MAHHCVRKNLLLGASWQAVDDVAGGKNLYFETGLMLTYLG